MASAGMRRVLPLPTDWSRPAASSLKTWVRPMDRIWAASEIRYSFFSNVAAMYLPPFLVRGPGAVWRGGYAPRGPRYLL